jgi:hypothetical protein
MFRFNCQGKLIIDERFRDVINDWANANEVDPESVFARNGWVMADPPFPLSMLVKNRINTSIFEEVEVIND